MSLRNAVRALFVLPFVRNSTGQPDTLPWPEEPLDLPTASGGGFYAAALGEVLSSQYMVLRKLGWGQHSNVWLTQNIKDGTYTTIKILSAHATSVQGKLSYELDLLKNIRSVDQSSGHAGFSHVVHLRDNFRLESLHGEHLCLATEVLGTSLNSVKREFASNQIPVNVVKEITRQLLSALDFLHNDCRIVHTDIKPDNVHLAIEDVESALANEPHREPPTIPNLSQFPVTPVISRPVSLPTVGVLTPDKVQIKLSDFGVAAARDGFHAEVIQPIALRATEVILGCGWDTSADIWNLGCIVFELLTGRWLFVPRDGPTWTLEDYHLAHMSPIAGDTFNTEFFRCGKHFHKYFHEDGRHRILVDDAADLPKALRTYNILGDEELPICADFLRSMLRLDPSNRATVRQLLEHNG